MTSNSNKNGPFSIAYNWSSQNNDFLSPPVVLLFFTWLLQFDLNLVSISPREPTKYLSFCENSALLPSVLLLCRILSSVLSSAKHCPVQFQCNLKMQKRTSPLWPRSTSIAKCAIVQRAPKLKFLQRKCELCPVAKHKSWVSKILNTDNRKWKWCKFCGKNRDWKHFFAN